MAGKPKGKLPYGIDWHPPIKGSRNPRYRVRIFYDGKHRHVGIFDTITDAKVALDKARGEKAAEKFVPPAERRRRALRKKRKKELKRVTISQWADRWISDLEKSERSAGTLATYRSALRVWIKPNLGDIYLTDLDKEIIWNFRRTVTDAGTGWGNIARTLRSMLHAAADQKIGGLKRVPDMGKIEKSIPSKAEDARKVATVAEVEALEAAMPDDVALAVPLAAWACLRASEVLGLTRQAFSGLGKATDKEPPLNATLTVFQQWNPKTNPPSYTAPKSDSEGTVTLPPSVAVKVREHLADYVGPGGDAPLFPSATDPSRPMSHNAFRARWNKARDQVRPGYRFHDLRHTGLTRAAQTGATLAEIQSRGRHKDIKTALRYQHAESERDRAIASKLDTFIEGQ